MKLSRTAAVAGMALVLSGVIGSCLAADETPAGSQVRTWIAASRSLDSIVSELEEQGMTTEEVLPLLVGFANKASAIEVLQALLAHGMTAEEAAAVLSALHSEESAEDKLARLEQLGLEFYEYVRLLVGLYSSDSTAERMDSLVAAGLTLQQSIDFLVYFTLAPTLQEDLLGAMTGAGLSLASAANILLEAEAPAEFAVPLQNLARLPFGPGSFSNDPLSGTAGGGVSTSQ